MNYLKRVFGLASLLAGLCGPAVALACTQCVKAPEETPALKIVGAKVSHLADLGLLVFEVEVEGSAGSLTPEPVGKLDGAPVLGYVFPTTLKPDSVGFGEVEGILALAVTSHPDFDDTPLWDESLDGAAATMVVFGIRTGWCWGKTSGLTGSRLSSSRRAMPA